MGRRSERGEGGFKGWGWEERSGGITGLKLLFYAIRGASTYERWSQSLNFAKAMDRCEIPFFFTLSISAYVSP